jgi:hypothetical protein
MPEVYRPACTPASRSLVYLSCVPNISWFCTLKFVVGSIRNANREKKPDAEFFDVIGKKVLRVFLLVIHSHLY